MDNPRGRASDPEETRRRLLDAADRVFAERGFHAATLEEICQAAGFTRGAFYANFESKEELFLAVMEAEDAHAADAAATARATFAERLTFDIQDRLTAAERRQRDLVRIEFVLYAARRPELFERFMQTARARRAALASELAHLAADLGLEPPLPVEDLAVILLALNTGLAMGDWFLPADEHQGQRLFSALLDAIVRAARPVGPRPS